ncbi:alkaline phosphatase-like protein [Corynespora cassiicola Philippines]|uniref:Alkaline phosphatase n=1 Tax=Corynespora cassiicola Philippines TaxID=1448308 RepID=A0A2T2NIM7_CORCC|nr:alkaline phosphatase-like protein [Corynespora cassiicola Philippines]
MPGTRPLLSNRPSSELSADRDLAEEDALLTGQPTQRTDGGPRTWKFWREIGLFVWAVLATAIVIVLAVVYQKSQDPQHSSPHPSGKRNLIFMVSDGMGPTSLSLTRSFMQYQNAAPWGEQLVIDQHLIGQSRTRSSSSLITDSAAGATAFSCGLKSYNGAISVDPDHNPCGTVLEAAKQAGYMTGLVVTTRITDATPACFASHVNMRQEEDLIAQQMVGDYPLGRVVDLMFGGGRCHFLPNSTEESCRADGRDIVAMAKEKGFSYISDRKSFDDLNGGSGLDLPMLGLFAPTDIPYEIDRRNENDIYPSLHEMAETALKALSEATRDSDKGFFLMIEGSRIDHAGHHNDPAAQVHEVLAYDETFAAVLDFLEKDSTEGVMVSTSDHETGGLATARQLHASYPEYVWYPAPLANASHSAERLALELQKYLESDSSKGGLESFVRESISEGLGIKDYSDEELKDLIETPETALYQYADMISRRSQTGWSTHGHSAADVNIYSSDPKAAMPLVGNHENTEVGKFLREYLNVDVEAVTKELREKGLGLQVVDANGTIQSWMGPLPEEGQRLDGQNHLASYEGDFKKRHFQHGRSCGCGH